MDETLKLILGELEKVNTRLDRLDSGQKELKISQDQLQQNQNQLQTSQDQLQKNQNQLQASQDQLQKNQNQLQASQDQLQKNQNQLQTSQDQLKDNLINGLGPYFEHIEKHIDAKTSKITETLEDQQRVIDTLAARSVRHESDIKDFKRILKNQ
ncbi:hypothetical protein [Rossellomorea aquimaris]|uniref:Uncharacterized protein n=1 Tax=Rossellomorea aquimaris TaxID=189382 RepID=A0A366ECT9_9BACI|nr:hypothetical protein [Rossellomorea aquimaris]RBP00207.1 hypothetical protein DET59_12524 [Rossellomorea aquimaris]